MKEQKTCNHCGTTENLRTRIVRGKLQILSICEDCKSKQMKAMWADKEKKKAISKKISKTTKENAANRTPEELEILAEKQRKAWFSKPKEERKKIAEQRGKGIRNSPKNKKRIQKIKEFYESVDQEYYDERTTKTRETLANATDEVKKQRKLAKSKEATRRHENRTEEELQQIQEKRRQTWESKSQEEIDEIYKRVTHTKKEKWSALSVEEQEQIKKERVKKQLETKANWSEEKKKEFSRKITEGNLRRSFTPTANMISKAELRCLEYIKENVDQNVWHQVRYDNKWIIDFYLPKYGFYLQFDGDFYHGKLNTEEELLKYGGLGKGILSAMKKDKQQNKQIPNLIRVWESEFNENPEIIFERISNKCLKNLEIIKR